MQKREAVELRKRGLSYQEILSKVRVSKSTLSLWLREVPLSQAQASKLLMGRDKSRMAAAKWKHDDRIRRTELLFQEGKNEVPFLVKDPLFIAGLALYWAEGSKDPTESVKFANSDPNMIVLIMRWFREVCKIPESKFRIHMHIHNLHMRDDVENFWSELTSVPRKQFSKTYIKKSTLGFRRNVLYNGTCTIAVNSKQL